MHVEKRLELVHLQITRNCNLRCWFCGQWGKKGFFSDACGSKMTLDDWKKVIDSLENCCKTKSTYPSVMLWGGEPLTSPYFGDITAYLRQKGFDELGIVTNGVLIDKWADVLRNDFKKIYISIDGPKEIHDSIRGNGVFDKVTANAKLLCGGNAEITVMTVLSPALLPILPGFPKLLEDIRPKQLLLQDMIYLSKEETEQYGRWFESCFKRPASEIYSWQMDIPPDYDYKKSQALKKVFEEKYSFEIKHMPHGMSTGNKQCLSPFRHIHVAWNGNVMYCTDFYDFCAGNVKENDIIDIFNNELSEKFREETYNGNCITCNHCSWRNNKEFRL